jgi:hypothetical protein
VRRLSGLMVEVELEAVEVGVEVWRGEGVWCREGHGGGG